MSIWSPIARYRRQYLLGTVLLLVTNLAANGIPWLMKMAVDAIEAGDGEAAVRACWWLAGLALVGGIARVFSRIVMFFGARQIEYDLRNQLHLHLISMHPSYFSRQRTGDLMSRVTHDVSYMRLLYGPGLLNVINTACAYSMALPLLLVIDSWLTLWTLLPIPLMLLASRRVARSIQRDQRAVQDQLAAITERLHETLSGSLLVRTYGLEDREREAFSERNEAYLIKSLSLVKTRGLFMPLVASVAGLGGVIVLLLGGRAVAQGAMGLGDLVAFLGYLGMLTWPTMALGWVISSWQRGKAALERIDEVLEVQPAIVGPPGEGPANVSAELRVENLTFGYADAERPSLEGVSVALPAGGSLGIVGRTGSGKTTLTRCLLRLLDVPSGTVSLGGVDVCEWPVDALRRQFAYVPQEAFLFSETLLKNIAFGCLEDPDAPIDDWLAAVRSAARLAALEPDLGSFPDGLKTVVGERGITLSGGQRQRTALARALMLKRPILVLDDTLSAVDAETERGILDGVRSKVRERTTVVVSHRLTAVSWCDEIVVLDEGRIVERGDHRQLLEADGWYAATWRMQQTQEEVVA